MYEEVLFMYMEKSSLYIWIDIIHIYEELFFISINCIPAGRGGRRRIPGLCYRPSLAGRVILRLTP